MRINYDFSDLEAFLAVRDTGSFHAAAERLNLSQSAVTRRVQKLEQALDSVLFERTTRAVKPTLAAKRLHPRAEAIVNDAAETARAMRDESVAFVHQRNALVTIATVSTVISRLLTPAIHTFRDSPFSARIRLLEASANEVAETVAEGEADFGLCSIPMLEPSTLFEPLYDDQIVLALPLSHVLARKTSVSFEELKGTPLILPARGTGNRLLIDEAMERARLRMVWAHEVTRSSTALELVASNIGAALLPRSVFHSASAAQVATCELHDLEITRPIGLLSRVSQIDTPPIAAIKDAIRSAV